MKKPAFKYTDFTNYFSNIQEKIDLTKRSPVIDHISHYISVRNVSSFLVLEGIPDGFLIDYIEKNMIDLSFTGPIYFEIVLFKDVSHLYAVYNQIIGSNLIAKIKTTTIPLYGRTHETT